jgi:formamidopyrimidine-DNA glycosylase
MSQLDFATEMNLILLQDLSLTLEGTQRRNETARWTQGYKSGRKKLREELREYFQSQLCGYGQTGCQCERCQGLLLAVNHLGGVVYV